MMDKSTTVQIKLKSSAAIPEIKDISIRDVETGEELIGYPSLVADTDWSTPILKAGQTVYRCHLHNGWRAVVNGVGWAELFDTPEAAVAAINRESQEAE